MRFEFATATRILFGAGRLRELGAVARDCGHRALLVIGRDPARAEPLRAILSEHKVESVIFNVTGEPSIESVERGTAVGREEQCNLVIGFGGGSAIDAGKAIAAMLANPGTLLDYLEVVGSGKVLTKPSLPFIAVPTTAGTGSEVTRNAVLSSAQHRVKASLRSPSLLPRLALVDPELAYDLPPAITAMTGLDALTQLIEPYVCSRTNPMTDALCVEGIRCAGGSLRTAYENGRDKAAREHMATASLFGGLALANAGLGAVHGFAGPIGGMFPAPHGAICARLLAPVMAMNLRALRARQPNHPALSRYEDIGRLLTGRPGANADEGVAWVQKLVTDLAIPSLASYGIDPSHFLEVVEKASEASSMKANPIVLTAEELSQILQAEADRGL
jgi:alcohol dehydrogenase class IV